MKAINLTYLALLLLLALTVGASFLPLSLPFSEAIALGIAGLKAILIGAVFMKLREEDPSLRFIALIGFVWVFLLIAFISSDYLTRGFFGVLGK